MDVGPPVTPMSCNEPFERFHQEIGENPTSTAETIEMPENRVDRMSWNPPFTDIERVRALPREPAILDGEQYRPGAVESSCRFFDCAATGTAMVAAYEAPNGAIHPL